MWVVTFSKKAAKQAEKLSVPVLSVLRLLVESLGQGPSGAHDWPNYGKLHGKRGEDKRHCHLLKGRPTYVCCWEVVDTHSIEVYYVGTHENAPY